MARQGVETFNPLVSDLMKNIAEGARNRLAEFSPDELAEDMQGNQSSMLAHEAIRVCREQIQAAQDIDDPEEAAKFEALLPGFQASYDVLTREPWPSRNDHQ